MKFTGCYSSAEIAFIKPRNPAVLISFVRPDTPLLQLADYSWHDMIFIDLPFDNKLVEIADLLFWFIQRHWLTDIYSHCESGLIESASVRNFLHLKGWTLQALQRAKPVAPNLHLLNELEKTFDLLANRN